MAEEELRIDGEIPRETQRISEPKRFGMLVAGAYGCLCVSLSYGFNIFSGDLQKAYELSQADMSTISTVGIVFAYFGIPYAFVYDYLGVTPVFVIGLVLITVGSLLMALTFNGTVTASVLRLCIFNGIFNFGTGVYDLACVVTVIGLFPTRKGVVVAVMKTYIGLGSAIIGAIQLAYFEGSPTKYFFFLMGFGGIIGVLALILIRQPPYLLTDYERSRLTDAEIEKTHHDEGHIFKAATAIHAFCHWICDCRFSYFVSSVTECIDCVLEFVMGVSKCVCHCDNCFSGHLPHCRYAIQFFGPKLENSALFFMRRRGSR
ncbi:putative protein associated with differentiation 8 [Trypanosoma cruzi]|uniref:Nodulin-like domain-containing protein n=1 Tax=Trypanosoma cruzi TaxID=5693 RepID=A0A2V2V2F8_TRYCR|nr:putative protein associated with differentiation 8 [Trypanosoma cruzi]